MGFIGHVKRFVGQDYFILKEMKGQWKYLIRESMPGLYD